MLINFVNRLPSMGGSHYVEELRQDPDMLEVLAGLDDEDIPSWTPRGTEWRQETELLTKIYDVLHTHLAIDAARGIPQGARRPTIPKPHVRPPRAIEAARIARREKEQADLDDEVEAGKARYRAAQQRGELPDNN